MHVEKINDVPERARCIIIWMSWKSYVNSISTQPCDKESPVTNLDLLVRSIGGYLYNPTIFLFFGL